MSEVILRIGLIVSLWGLFLSPELAWSVDNAEQQAVIKSGSSAVNTVAGQPSKLGRSSLTQTLFGIDAFSVVTTDGKTVELKESDEQKFTVICFLATECPLCRLYAPRLNEIANDYADRGVEFIGIDSNLQDTQPELAEFAQRLSINFPVAKDNDQKIARDIGATRNPEVFVVDKDLRIRYRGRIDNQYQPGTARDKPTQDDLRLALDQLLANENDFEMQTQAVGCLITFQNRTSENSKVTYHQDIKPVLERNCVECHQAGEIGPFALTDYDDVVGWGEMMLEVIDQHRMPPWHADDSVEFANARAMQAEDKVLLRQWVKAGMPQGKPTSAPSAEGPSESVAEDENRELILPMAEVPFAVPADGVVDYQYFVVDPKFTEDRWVKLAEVIPGNRSVVHHVIVFVRPPDDEDFRDISLLCAYVPGQETFELPAGHAQRIRAGSHFVFQMHYTPNGEPQSDLTRIALDFIDSGNVTHNVFSIAGIQQDFEIPPHSPSHKVHGSVARIPTQATLLAVTPHMHVRGKSFSLSATTNGQAQPLLNVPNYDFNWQHNYVYKHPLPMSNMESIDLTATFDNSSDNPNNPAPHEFVTWGDQTWEEMAIVFLTVAEPIKVEGMVATTAEPVAESSLSETEVTRFADLVAKALPLAKERLAKLDRNKDGRVTKDESPRAFLMYQFSAIDRNGDGVLDLDEFARHIAARRAL